MGIVHRWDPDSFDDPPSLAVAIGGEEVSGDPERRHAGLLFKPEDQPQQLIHLGWHGYFKCEEPSANYCWVDLSRFHPVLLDNIADWLPQVWRENGRNIAYSIKPFDKNPFDENGKVQLTEPGDGFTCATFVLWVFHRWNMPLIKLEEWQDRPKDLEWRKWIMQTLRETQTRFEIPEAHIQAQLPFVEHAARFRPEEVAGVAGYYGGVPASFTYAIDRGLQVLAEMTELGMLTKAK